MKLGFEIIAWFVLGVFFTTCTLIAGSVMRDCWRHVQRRRLERQRKRLRLSLRAEIVRVGTIEFAGWNPETGMPRYAVDGWIFRPTFCIPFLHTEDGVTYLCGYPPNELEEIAARRSEWGETEAWR